MFKWLVKKLIGRKIQNSLIVIVPYKWQGMWVFDDELTGLYREALVSGVPEILERLISENHIFNAHNGFRLIFSASPFPGYQVECTHDGVSCGGNWYKTEKNERGWLCPALFKYFSKAPAKLYARVESI